MKSTLSREMDKIKTNLEGIRKMERMPGVMFIIDTRREHIAVKEAKKLGVPTIALIDTDSDPDLIDLPIPGNDDAMRAIEIIMRELADAVIEGKQGRADKPDDAASRPRRRARRSRSTPPAFRADEGGPRRRRGPARRPPQVDLPAEPAARSRTVAGDRARERPGSRPKIRVPAHRVLSAAVAGSALSTFFCQAHLETDHGGDHRQARERTSGQDRPGR